MHAIVAQLVEHRLPKPRVTSSSLAYRSTMDQYVVFTHVSLIDFSCVTLFFFIGTDSYINNIYEKDVFLLCSVASRGNAPYNMSFHLCPHPDNHSTEHQPNVPYYYF